MKYAWIEENRYSYPVALLCAVLEVSTSGYYAWLKRGPSPQDQRREVIAEAAERSYHESDGVCGRLCSSNSGYACASRTQPSYLTPILSLSLEQRLGGGHPMPCYGMQSMHIMVCFQNCSRGLIQRRSRHPICRTVFAREDQGG